MNSDRFFNPDGIAIIGASRNPHKLGYGVVRNLKEYRYKGGIYPVNPSAGEILGLPCFSSIDEVPEPVDLAVVIVPAGYVSNTLTHVGKRGIGQAIIVSGGFSETGKQGEQLENDILSVSKKYGIRLLGPNCIGLIDTHHQVNTTFVTGMPEQGEIGLASQSGATVAAVIDWARGTGVGFSRIVSLGNQVDINETQMIEAINEDRQTRVITAYIEGLTDGRAFMETAENVARNKPLIVLKAGRGKSGAKAVVSHTGALAGSSEAYRAAFRRCGVLQAENTEEMFDWARALAWQPLPKGNRVAVLTNAGGPGILAVDALEESALELAPLTEETRSYLTSRMPAAASVTNPVDVLAGSGPGTYAVALDALLADETVDSVVVIQAPQDWFLPASLAEVVAEVASVHNKPVITSLMGKMSIEDALGILNKRKIPNVTFPERLASVLKVMVERRRWLETPVEPAPQFDDVDIAGARKAVDDQDWPALLSIYGIQTPVQHIAATADEAVNAADQTGYPVVMKLISETITHKTDIDGVQMNLTNNDEVREAWQKISDSIHRHNGSMQGVLIQQMLHGGQEVILGIHQDPQFGPMIMFGTGGVDVELLKDVASDVAPLNTIQADNLIDATRAGIRLSGWRNSPAADRDSVRNYLMRLARLAVNHPEISELEINPLYVMPAGEGAMALDIRGSAVMETRSS